MSIKEYKFLVSMCGGWCNGTLVIKAEDEDEAYDKAMDYVGDKLSDAFPDLDIEYNVELYEPIVREEEQNLRKLLEIVDKALVDFASDNVDVLKNEETNMYDVIYHSRNNSFAIYKDVIRVDSLDLYLGELEEELDKRNVGYCG